MRVDVGVLHGLLRRVKQCLALPCVLLLLFATLTGPATAVEAAPASADPALEARVQKVSAELRCLVCQNETIASSNAELAVDLRNQVREMLRAGQSERDVFDYMQARYGEFVLYRPPLRSSTAVLWFGPFVLLGLGLFSLWWMLRKRNRLPPESFEPDENP